MDFGSLYTTGLTEPYGWNTRRRTTVMISGRKRRRQMIVDSSARKVFRLYKGETFK
jgi:hypothetical protein